MKTTLALAAAAFLATTGVASADTIPGLYNTGVDDNGNKLATGQNDTHWAVNAFGTPVTYDNGLYVQSPNASFIGAGPDGSGGGGYFSLEFFLTADQAATGTISGDFAYDNTVTAYINGRQFYQDNTDAPGSFDAFEKLHHFSFNNAGSVGPEGNAYLTTGYNFLIFNVGDYQTPSGLLVTNLAETGAVPEPATWAMMVLGFGMVGFGLRSRRKQTVRVTYA